jgi:hypothetical protein
VVHHQNFGPPPEIGIAGECVRGFSGSGPAGNPPSSAPQRRDLVAVLLEQSGDREKALRSFRAQHYFVSSVRLATFLLFGIDPKKVELLRTSGLGLAESKRNNDRGERP